MNEIDVVARLLGVINMLYITNIYLYRLTNSLYRYLTATASCLDFRLRRQFNCHVTPNWILQKHKEKKRKKIDLMGGRLPASDNACYGGTFIVSDDESSNDDWSVKLEAGQDGKRCIPPNFRSWQSVNYSGEDGPDTFKLMCYNVLAQNLLESHPNLYANCVFKNLQWKERSSKLYDEIVTLAPDILCLQEVQESDIQCFYSKLEKLGYGGVFKRKTGDKQDGCAIYYKKKTFKLLDNITVEFNQPDLPLLNRDNIGVMVMLMPCRGPRSPIVVATTHLLYNPRRNDVRLAQIQVFLAEIDRFSFYDNGIKSGHLPIILTGDLNSTPDSEVIKLLKDGCVSTENVQGGSDFKQIGITDNCQHLEVMLNREEGRPTDFSQLQLYNSDYCAKRPEPKPSTGEFMDLFKRSELKHNLKLGSVYTNHDPNGEGEATTFQGRWVTVDYIFFSSRKLNLTQRLRLPTAKECDILKSLPNEVFGSDHLALAAVFEISSRKRQLPRMAL